MRVASIVTDAAGVSDGTVGNPDASAMVTLAKPRNPPSASIAEEHDDEACETNER